MKQLSMFTQGEDTPLFSGTAQRSNVDPYKPRLSAYQPPLIKKYQLFDTKTNKFIETRQMTSGQSAKLNAELRKNGTRHLSWVTEWSY